MKCPRLLEKLLDAINEIIVNAQSYTPTKENWDKIRTLIQSYGEQCVQKALTGTAQTWEHPHWKSVV